MHRSRDDLLGLLVPVPHRLLLHIADDRRRLAARLFFGLAQHLPFRFFGRHTRQLLQPSLVLLQRLRYLLFFSLDGFFLVLDRLRSPL